jgi:hypothetical protein
VTIGMPAERKKIQTILAGIRAELGGPLSVRQEALLGGLEGKLAALTRAAEELNRQPASVVMAGAFPLCFQRYLKLSDSVREDLLVMYGVESPPGGGGMDSDDGAP